MKQTREQTTRALLVLGEDIRALTETTDRVRAQFDALAERHGIEPLQHGGNGKA